MTKKNKRRTKKKSHREHNGIKKLLVFPQSNTGVPAFREALWNEFERSLKSPDGQLRVNLAFPGRSLVEAQEIRADLTRLFEKDLWEACRAQGIV